MTIYKGRITKIEKDQMTSAALTQKVKGKDQWKYDNSDKYHGSNGSYISDIETAYFVKLYLTIYETQTEPSRWAEIDIRESILSENGVQKISSKLMNEIKVANENKKVSFNIENGKITFLPGELILKFR